MTLQILRVAGLAAALLAGAALPALADDPVVVKINGKEYHRSALEELLKASPNRAIKLADVYPQVLENFVPGQILLAEATKAKLADDPVVKQQQKLAAEQVLGEAFLRKKVEASLTDDVLRKQYDELKSKGVLKSQAQVQARHILVDKEDEAKQIITDLKGGAKFEDIAKAKSKDPSGKENGGDLGFFGQQDMVPEFSAVAFKLKKGELSETPVQTKFGWHVIQVTDTRSLPAPAFEDVKPQLKQQLGQQAAQKAIGELISAAKIEVFDLNGKPLPQGGPAGAPAGDAGIPVKP